MILSWIRSAIAMVLVLSLTACATIEPSRTPAPTPTVEDQPLPDPTLTAPDAETLEKTGYYLKIEKNYLSQGRLRTDAGGGDSPFSAADLARNAIAIAFFDEFADRGGKLVAGGGERRLVRWSRPVRVGLEFGPSVPLDVRRRDRVEVVAYLSRLSRLTGLPIRLVGERPNFLILVQNPSERRAARARIVTFAPGTSKAALASALELEPSTYCTVFGYTPGKSPFYERSLAMIRAELPDLMRRMCYQEEIAQGLGLINDSPRARPSIFNDTEEFAVLTRHDELILKLLYDPRLKPGMTLAEARPIIESIAAELLPGQS